MADPKYANLPGIVSFRWIFFLYLLQFPTYAYCFSNISPLKYCISMAFEFPQHANSSIIRKPCSKLQYQVICLQGCKLVDVYRYKHAYVIYIHD